MTALVLVAVVATVLTTAAFLVAARDRDPADARHARGASPAARVLASLPGLVLAGALLVPVLPPSDVGWSVLALWVTTLVWVPLTSRWSALGHASWALSASTGLAYVLAMALWTTSSGLTGFSVVGAWALWALEVAAYVLVLAYGWEIHDALASRTWQRRLGRGAGPAPVGADEHHPFVSIHVPSHREPPEMVIATLRSLLDLDYPAYEVLLVDNNTDDDTLVAPVEAFCRAHPERLRFHRLLDWPGFKSGALNYAEEHSDPRTELIAVVDADYQVDPGWLRDTVGAFADASVAFVQTPQDYRDWTGSQYLRSLYYSYDYFFAVSQPSRDERNSAIFGGTMGLVRREALRDVGGWDEWCVTEDAELSLRLLARGWSGHHVDRTFGHGVMPLTFEALKRQRFRWCFGGMQILKRHWRMLMPWHRGTRLDLAQRVGYLNGGIQWLGDLVGLLFSLLVVLSLVDLALGGGLVVRRLSGLLVLAVPALVLVGLVRAVAVVKAVGRDATWRDALGAFLIWLSLGWVVAMACVRGLVEPRGVFLRTPKVRGDVHWFQAVRAHVVEVGLAVVALASAAGGVVARPGWVTVGLSGLLVVPVAGWLAAPAHSIAAMRADLPADLRRRRTAEWARGWWGPRARTSLATVAGVGALAAVVMLLVQPASHEAPRTAALPRVGPSPGHHTAARHAPGTSTTTTSSSTAPVGVAPVGVTTSSSSRSAASSSASPSTTSRPSATSTTPSGSPTTVPSPTSVGSPTSAGSPTSVGSPTTRPTPTRTTPTPTHRPTTTGHP